MPVQITDYRDAAYLVPHNESVVVDLSEHAERLVNYGTSATSWPHPELVEG